MSVPLSFFGRYTEAAVFCFHIRLKAIIAVLRLAFEVRLHVARRPLTALLINRGEHPVTTLEARTTRHPAQTSTTTPTTSTKGCLDVYNNLKL